MDAEGEEASEEGDTNIEEEWTLNQSLFSCASISFMSFYCHHSESVTVLSCVKLRNFKPGTSKKGKFNYMLSCEQATNIKKKEKYNNI